MTRNSIICGRLAMTVLCSFPLWSAAASAQTEAYPRAQVHDVALQQIETVISFARHPELISQASLETLFRTKLRPDHCDRSNWSCRWSGPLIENEVSLTNAFFPNPEMRNYRSGANLLLEIPLNACVAKTNLNRLLDSTPSSPTAPTTYFSFSNQGTPRQDEQLEIFTDVPGIRNEVKIRSWSYGECLVRLELDALL